MFFNFVSKLRLGSGIRLGFVLLFCLSMPLSVQAEECLKFTDTPTVSLRYQNVAPNFSVALKEAGICNELFHMSLKRSILELRSGRLDGVVMRVPAFKELIGDAAVMIHEPVVKASGLLISNDPSITSIKSLAGRPIAVRLAAIWQKKMVGGYINIQNVSDRVIQIKMLKQNRIDAILLTNLTVDEYKKELNGTNITKLKDLSGFPWIRKGLEHRAKEIVAAIRAYQAKGRTFLDKPFAW